MKKKNKKEMAEWTARDDVRYLLHLEMLETEAKGLFLDGLISGAQYDIILRRCGGTP